MLVSSDIVLVLQALFPPEKVRLCLWVKLKLPNLLALGLEGFVMSVWRQYETHL